MRYSALIFVTVLALGFTSVFAANLPDTGLVSGTTSLAPDAAAQIKQRMAGLAVPFEANTGQADKRVAFMARTLGGTLFVTRAGQLVHSFPGLPLAAQGGVTERNALHQRGPGWVLTETMTNARPTVRGGVESKTLVSRFIGNDSVQWQPQINTFQTISLGEAWPGISVELAARGNNVEKLFTVAPGADAQRINIRLKGAKRLELAADGALIAHTGNGPVSFTPPVAWQDIGDNRHAVTVAYALTGDHYGFRLGDYNSTYPVVIDPLLQATYLGGNGADYAYAMVLDGSVPPNVFVAGSSASSNFPGTTGGAQTTNHGGNYSQDVFVAKLTNDLKTITQATYLGGSGDDYASAIAVDTVSGAIYLAGSTVSTNFPGTTGGAKGTNSNTFSIGFVAKLTSDLKTLTQATYLGGSGSDYASAIALDGSTPPNVFVVGRTSSSNFPHTTGGAQAIFAGYRIGFVAKLTNDLTAFIQSTYLGGTNGYDAANAIALDTTTGDVFVAGYAGSTNFPGTSGGAQASHAADGGFGDAFVAKLNNNLTTISRATYLGGNATDQATTIVLDGSTPPNVFVAGLTQSSDFPHTNGGAQQTYGGVGNGFVAKLSNDLAGVNQATYLGGSGWDQVNAIALDRSTPANVFVAGWAGSANFPGTTGGAQAVYGGGVGSNAVSGDAYVAKMNNNLTAFIQATYLGGSGNDGASAIALDTTTGNVFVVGYTISSNFPGTTGGAQTSHAADSSSADAFVAKLTPDLAAVLSTSTLFLEFDPSGTGSGSMTAPALGLSCGSNCSSIQMQNGTQYTVTATPSQYALLYSLNGPNCLAVTGFCTFTPASNTTVTARFDYDMTHQAYIPNGVGQGSYYSSLQAAYNASVPGSMSTVLAWNQVYIENLTCSINKAVTLKGGYNQGYTSVSGWTTLSGILTIGLGSVTIEEVAVK